MREVIVENFKRKTETIQDEDIAILKKIGISHRPFFKFTKGGNSIAVYAYENKKREKLVVKLKEVWEKGIGHTLFDHNAAKNLWKRALTLLSSRRKARPPSAPHTWGERSLTMR